MTPQIYYRLSQHSTAIFMVKAGDHKVAFSTTNKPGMSVNIPRNLRMRIQALMTDDCRLHQYTGLGELFGILSLYAATQNLKVLNFRYFLK